MTRHFATLATLGLLAGLALACPSAALADGPPCLDECQTPIGTGGGSGSQTVGFVGLQWNFGSSSPEVTGGVRYLTQNSNGVVYGAQADASVPLMGGNFGPTVRLLGLAGNTDVQAQAGGGFDFATQLPVASFGGQAPYVTAGANVELGGDIRPYIGLNSLARPSLGEDRVLSCAVPYSLVQVVNGLTVQDNRSVDPSQVLDGYTCYAPG